MRRMFAILALAVCLFTGCEINVNPKWPRVELGQSSVSVSPNADSYTVDIYGGSGDFLAEISDRTVADVHIEATYGGPGHVLVIEPKREGEAILTVIDRKTASFDLCSLEVTKYSGSFKIADIQWSVDADSPAEIEAALEADASVPSVGGAILLSTWNSTPELAFADADGKEFAHGTLKREDLTEENGNPIFGSLLPAVQFIGWEKWTLLYEGGGAREFHMYTMRRPGTRLNVLPSRNYQYLLCEDVTERYKAEFSDAGVRSVARVLISNGGN